MRVNNKKKFLIFGLVFVAFFMALGYSLLSATLSISTVNRVTGSWDIHINPSATSITTTGSGESQSFRISNDKKEISILKRDFEKAKVRYSRKYEGYQLNQKLYAYLASKGYKYQDIKKVLDVEDFE